MAINSTSRATIEVTTNTQKAKNDIEEIHNLLKRLQKTKQLMMKEGLALGKDGKETATFKKLNQDIKTATQALKDNTNAQEKMKATLSDLGNIRLKDLKRRYRELSKELGNFTANEGKQAKQWRNNLDKIRAKISQIEGSTGAASKQMAGFGGALKTTLKNLVAYAGVFAIFNKIKSTLTDLFKKNIEFSDELTNIRKVSQLTEQDINRLAVGLAKIDTRSSVHELNNLAYAGAKLGIGKWGVEGLNQFVVAADKVNVALKEDLGDDALTAMSKLVEVMGLIPKMGVEKSMEAAGSAIFALSTSSTSTGANIIEFSKRLMGLANVSHVAVEELLALGSASDAMGLMAEVSATAFNKVFTSIQTNTRGIARALGDTKGELQALVDQGKTMDAIVYVLDRMHTMSVEEMKGRGLFKALGSDGARLNNVIATMANRVDMLKEHLDISSEAFTEATAIQKEYEMQMESAAGYMDRARNVWEKAFVNPEGVDVVKQYAVEWYNVSNEMTHSGSQMAMINTTLKIMAGTIKTLIQFLPVLLRLMSFYGIGFVLQSLYKYVLNLRTALLSAAGAGQKLNAVMRANLFAFAFAAVMTLITALTDLNSAQDDATKSANQLNAAIAGAEAEYKKNKKSLDSYVSKLQDASLAEDERNKILRKFNKEFGTYLNKLGLEAQSVVTLKSKYEALNEELRKNAYYRMGQNLKETYVKDSENAESGALGKLMTVMQERGLDVSSLVKAREEGKGYTGMLQKAYEQAVPGVTWDKEFPFIGWDSNGKIFSTVPLGFNRESRRLQRSERGKQIAGLLFNSEASAPVDMDVRELYNAVQDYYNANVNRKEKTKQVDDLMKELGVDDYDPSMTVEGALGNLKRLKELSVDLLNEGLNALRKELDSMSEADRKADTRNLPDAIRRYEAQIAKLSVNNDYDAGPTKDEIKEEKESLRKDLQDAKRESDAIIAKVEEWYRLQETVITDMQADGKLTKEQADQAVRTLDIAKNTALRDARLAISGRNTEAWETTKQQIGNLMLDQGEWSQELLKQILGVSMGAIRRNLSRIDKGGGRYGITTSSLKDAVDKNAAGNQREVARLMARSQQEVEKIFMEYDFFEQAMRGFSNRLAQMGILSETARQMAERLSDANNPDEMFSMKDYDALLKGNEGAKQQMLQAFIRSGAQPYGVNPEDKEQLRAWFMEFVGQFVQNEEAFGGVEYQYQSWAKPFEQDFELWLRDSDKYLSSIQSFYLSLMKSEEDYYEKRKQSYNFYKKQLDQQDQAAGIPTQREDTERQLQTQATLQDNGIGASFWRQQGLGGILNDPEVMLIQKRIEWRNQDLESAKALLAGKEALWEQEKAQRLANGESEADIDADLAQRRMGFEDLIKERQTSLFDQQLAFTTKIAQEMRKRVQTVNNLTKPIQDGALNIGKKFGEMLAGVEEQSMTWKEIWHSMAVAVGESVIDMTAQYAQNLIMEKAMNAQSKQEAIDKANVDVAAGIASGSAKTIGTLGWWGIALIPVIAALLKGLLQAAFASNKSSDTAASSSNIKTKLVSGMLTYDEGNVYAGTDGHVYRATAQSSLPAGVSVVRHPIATTVNGHNALVAERGPEIVIGRRATRHIQMNEPGLLRHLATLNGRYRTYDQGTVPEGAPSLSERAGGEADARVAAALEQNTQMMAAFVQMMNTIQQRGIPAHINKYGAGGLIDEVKSGLQFDRRYNR